MVKIARCGCQRSGQQCSCVILGAETSCIDVFVGEDGLGTLTLPYEISAELKFDPDNPDDCLNCTFDGLKLVIDPSLENALTCGANGLFVPELTFDPDNPDNCLTSTAEGLLLVIDPDPENALDCGANGLFVATPVIPPGGGDAFMTVAASNTLPAVSAHADYVCDGTADNVEIQAALDSLDTNGGTVILLSGTFNTSAAITLGYKQRLVGEGWASQLIYSGSGYAITAPFNDHTGVERLHVQSSAAAGATVSMTGYSSVITDCYLLQNSLSSTISAVILGGTGARMVGCTVVATALGVTVPDGSDYADINGNYIESKTTILIDGADSCLVQGNRLRGAGWPTGNGIVLQGSADDNTITGNTLDEYGVDGIQLVNVGAATPDRNNIQMNTIRQGGGGDGYGINILSGTANYVTNNDLLTSGTLGSYNDVGTGTVVGSGNRL